MVAISDSTSLAEQQTIKYRFNRFLERHLPSGIYPRSLIIIITPMVLLQSIMAFIFMERHWDQVTKRLSGSVAREIAFLIEAYETFPKTEQAERQLSRMANEQLGLGFSMVRGEDLPPPAEKPFYSLLDHKLANQISKRIKRPFWINSVGRSEFVDIRIKIEDDLIFRILTRQSRAYASNSHIFILWMVGSAIVLLWVAIIFLRNQIRPIQQLAEAAQRFGMGRDMPEFRPRGAQEVQSASLAFLNMKQRIEAHVEQRTAMLAGVSHDLRTILTRFKLQLAFLEDNEQTRELRRDVDEMQHMLEDYMAFVRGDGGEKVVKTDIRKILRQIIQEARKGGDGLTLKRGKRLEVPVKPKSFKRCITNLVNNACRSAEHVQISTERDQRFLNVVIEDDGPGIPEDMYEGVFRPFVRLDDARNQDEGGTGLGLSIALDIARSHGGDIALSKSQLGGLKVILQLPL